MAEKTINGRLINKHDSETNWIKAVNFVPQKAELIVYDTDDSHGTERIKIGDGTTKVNDLPFYRPNYYGVCKTAAGTAAKTVTIDGFKLEVGAMVIVKFDNANSATSPTLNVSGTGAKPMYRYGTTALGTGTTTTGWYADSVQLLVYDGTGWIRDYWNNSTYSNAGLGQGYGTCSTAADTLAKTVSISSYTLATGGVVSIYFENAVPANATLNITSKGAKPIYYNGAAITDGVIGAGDTATFIYSTNYHLIALNKLVPDTSNFLMKTPQELTSEELVQVRSNLRFIGEDLEGRTFTIDGKTYTASPNAERFGDYENNIAIGQWSIAEGSTNIAIGRACHVEGAKNQALSDGCHVEGVSCIASGYWSHAEGEMTRVTSYASHAEGSYTKMPDGSVRYGTASGYASHIEGGGCHAEASCSHSEGLATTTKGNYSHSEGRYTIASSPAQHVEGTANIEDTASKYIHIAGNGEFTQRSNAYTLDWDGIGWFAGGLKIGGTSQDDTEAQEVVTTGYVISLDEIDAICGVV